MSFLRKYGYAMFLGVWISGMVDAPLLDWRSWANLLLLIPFYYLLDVRDRELAREDVR